MTATFTFASGVESDYVLKEDPNEPSGEERMRAPEDKDDSSDIEERDD